MADNFRHAQYREDGTQIDDPQKLVDSLFTVTPVTQDYSGCLQAIKTALAGNKCVLFEDAIYDLGNNYLPIIGGLKYIGAPTRLDYTAGGWTGRNRHLTGGTRFTTTHDYTFWDGVTDQASLTVTVAAQTGTVVAGSANIAVSDSSLFTVGRRVSFTGDNCGFFSGVAYFVLSAANNVITVSLADMTPVIASIEGQVTVFAGTPNDGTSHVVMENVHGLNVKTFIKLGAKNTFGCHYSRFKNIFVDGTLTARAFDICNYNQCFFDSLTCRDSDGMWFRCDYPLASFYPGNSWHMRPLVVRSDLTAGNDNYKQRGLVFQAEDGAQMNMEHVRFAESFAAYQATRTDASFGVTNGSANCTVTSAALWPLDLPVWVGSNVGGLTANTVYFVVANNGTTIQLSLKKQGTAVVANATGTATLRSQGYANVEFVGIGTGAISNSSFEDADIEANCTMHILLQRATVDVTLTQCPAGESHAGVVGRGHFGSFYSYEPQTTDFDTQPMIPGGRRTTGIVGSYAGIGFWLDDSLGASGAVALNLHPQHQQSTPSIVAATSGSTYYLKPGQAFGHRMRSQDTTTSLVGTGDYVFNGAAGQTLTLPTMHDTDASNTLLGAPFGIINASANNVTISTAGGQLLNMQAAKTSMTLTPGQWARYFGAKTAGGTSFVGVFTNGTI